MFCLIKMFAVKCTLFAALILVFQAWMVKSQCVLKKELNGNISDSTYIKSNYRTSQRKCWNILVPSNHFIRLHLNSLDFASQNCLYVYLDITVNETRENYKFCSGSNINPVIAFRDVTVVHNNAYTGSTYTSRFSLYYEIQDIECLNNNSFRCSNHSCIPKDKVCNGIKNCENGADEIGCEIGILAIEGVTEARKKAIAWLKSKRTPAWGWQENTSRAVTALFLAGSANFNGTNLEEELMAKHTELKISVALLRNSIPNEELSTFINALLVTCHNPRRFYSTDLIKRLKDQVVTSDNFTHPAAYLSLCNANESWPTRATTDLSSTLKSDSEYPFVRDIQAFAIIALSCMFNRTQSLNNSTNAELMSLYQRNIKRFKEGQFSDGSFGNVHTTTLIMQALVSSGEEQAKDWDLNAAIKYLIKELNTSRVNFLSTYMILPVLNGKSLADIAKVNCSANPRKHGDGDLVAEMKDYLGPKIRVRYSLFVGDEKDVIHTISLRVPENFTAYEVMQLAEVEDPKYKFEWKRVYGKIYVYEIGNIMNDPEGGKFWLLYSGSANNADKLVHYTSSPDELILKDGDFLTMWYKAAHI